MTTMNISLPEPLKEYVDQKVIAEGFSSASEYVRMLIRQDQARQAERHLAGLLADGLASGPAASVDAKFWAERRARLAR
jgi:antitoxin ParD1/3/4